MDMTKIQTGINGLDDLLRGGIEIPENFSQGLILLVKGRPGTGKSTLALQISANIARKQKNNGINNVYYFTCEQRENDIKRRVKEINNNKDVDKLKIFNEMECAGNDDDSISVGSRLLFWSRHCIDKLKELSTDHQANNHQSQKEKTAAKTPESAKNRQASVEETKQNSDEKNQNKNNLVVLDGLNLVRQDDRKFLEMHQIISRMRKYCQLGILIYDSNEEGFSSADFDVDMIIEMQGMTTPPPLEYFMNRLSITKSRFQSTGLGWHQYKIKKNGIIVFPSIHFRLSNQKLNNDQLDEPLQSIADMAEMAKNKDSQYQELLAQDDDDSLLTQIIGPDNLKKGSITVILGPRRTFKTLMTFDFLRTKHTDDHRTLLVSLMVDNQRTIIEQRKQVCEKICNRSDDKCQEPNKNKACFKNSYLQYFRPGCLSSGEFMDILEKKLWALRDNKKKREVQRLVFWDLTQLADRYPLLANEPTFLPLLMDHLKNSPYSNEENPRPSEENPRPSEENPRPSEENPRLIASLFMGALNASYSKMAADMADNVLICWRDQIVKDKIGKLTTEEATRGNEDNSDQLRNLFEEKTRHPDPNIKPMKKLAEKINQGTCECVAIAVDRIEGKPGEGRYFLLVELPHEDKAVELPHEDEAPEAGATNPSTGNGNNSSKTKVYLFQIKGNPEEILKDSPWMLKQIQAMQGFPVSMQEFDDPKK